MTDFDDTIKVSLRDSHTSLKEIRDYLNKILLQAAEDGNDHYPIPLSELIALLGMVSDLDSAMFVARSRSDAFGSVAGSVQRLLDAKIIK